MLLELDKTQVRADRERLRRELLAARLEVARLAALVEGKEGALLRFRPPAGIEPVLASTNRSLLRQRLLELRYRIGGYDTEIQKHHANRRTIEARIRKLTGTIPLLRRRVYARGKMARKGFGMQTAYLELKQDLVEMEGDHLIARRQLKEIDETIRVTVEKRGEARAGFFAKANEELSAALQKISALTEELRKAEDRMGHKTLRAPVAGTVQQLAVNTVGGVVNPADKLMIVVPEGARLEIEAMVLNKDVGFVRPGQEAVVKIESFPFTKYGTIPGKMVHVSADSIQDKDLGLVYAARVGLGKKRILVGDRWVALTPGMAVTVEVKTGKRKLIEFFLSPFLRYRDEALRER